MYGVPRYKAIFKSSFVIDPKQSAAPREKCHVRKKQTQKLFFAQFSFSILSGILANK
jgi:hypothetical protein